MVALQAIGVHINATSILTAVNEALADTSDSSSAPVATEALRDLARQGRQQAAEARDVARRAHNVGASLVPVLVTCGIVSVLLSVLGAFALWRRVRARAVGIALVAHVCLQWRSSFGCHLVRCCMLQSWESPALLFVCWAVMAGGQLQSAFAGMACACHQHSLCVYTRLQARMALCTLHILLTVFLQFAVAVLCTAPHTALAACMQPCNTALSSPACPLHCAPPRPTSVPPAEALQLPCPCKVAASSAGCSCTFHRSRSICVQTRFLLTTFLATSTVFTLLMWALAIAALCARSFFATACDVPMRHTSGQVTDGTYNHFTCADFRQPDTEGLVAVMGASNTVAAEAQTYITSTLRGCRLAGAVESVLCAALCFTRVAVVVHKHACC